MSIEERLQEIMRDVFDDPSITIRREMTAADVEGWDSLSHINLIVAIEKDFQLRFNLGEVKSLKNVGEMVDLLTKKLAKP